MMDAEVRLDGVVGVGDGSGVAVQRFELSPNGIGYPEITRRTSGIFDVFCRFKPMREYVQLHTANNKIIDRLINSLTN